MMSSLLMGALGACVGAFVSPKSPIKSSMLEAGAALPLAGEATRWGVPARPSSPECPGVISFCNEAGADPSKSISNRFSTLDCGGACPAAAAATASAAIGFSRASSLCSLFASQSHGLVLSSEGEDNILDGGLLHCFGSIATLPKECLWGLVIN